MSGKERVLIVDDDPDVRDLLMDQIFHPNKFEVFEARDGVEGLEIAAKQPIDLIYLDLVMPSLTGKDMLVGLKARNYHGPIIVGVKRGQEQSAIEAFRFGATDYITKPIREAEMQSVVTRALADVRLRKERDQLFEQLQLTNQQLQAHIQQLTTLQRLGQTVTAMHSLDGMFDAVLTGAIEVTKADHAMLILYDDQNDQFILRAGKNLTLVMQEKLGEVIKDDLARLVVTSQQPIVTGGDGLRRFKISRDILAVIYAPMIINGRAIGVLAVGNHRKRTLFDESLGQIVNALADYAAIAIVNARLFVELEKRANTAQHQLQQIIEPINQMNERLHTLINTNEMPSHVHKQLQWLQQQVQYVQQMIRGLR
ncbi:MAG: hypothetical protein CUN55_09285 [Phototrophicales bacterium]|nr:MAG: hypothetical protein CUN55_09285 [Phototrophicales bacterium]